MDFNLTCSISSLTEHESLMDFKILIGYNILIYALCLSLFYIYFKTCAILLEKLLFYFYCLFSQLFLVIYILIFWLWFLMSFVFSFFNLSFVAKKKEKNIPMCYIIYKKLVYLGLMKCKRAISLIFSCNFL